jgi:hypothetical protein
LTYFGFASATRNVLRDIHMPFTAVFLKEDAINCWLSKIDFKKLDFRQPEEIVSKLPVTKLFLVQTKLEIY